GVGAEHREIEIADEVLAQFVDEDLLDSDQLGFFARGFQLLALAQIGGEGDNFAAIRLLQPAQDDRGVEPARIGQHDLFHIRSSLCHRCFSLAQPSKHPRSSSPGLSRGSTSWLSWMAGPSPAMTGRGRDYR